MYYQPVVHSPIDVPTYVRMTINLIIFCEYLTTISGPSLGDSVLLSI